MRCRFLVVGSEGLQGVIGSRLASSCTLILLSLHCQLQLQHSRRLELGPHLPEIVQSQRVLLLVVNEQIVVGVQLELEHLGGGEHELAQRFVEAAGRERRPVHAWDRSDLLDPYQLLRIPETDCAIAAHRYELPLLIVELEEDDLHRMRIDCSFFLILGGLVEYVDLSLGTAVCNEV